MTDETYQSRLPDIVIQERDELLLLAQTLRKENAQLSKDLDAALRTADIRLTLVNEWKSNLQFECGLHKETQAERDSLRQRVAEMGQALTRVNYLEQVVTAAREHYSAMAVMFKEGSETRTEDDHYRAAMAAGALSDALRALDAALHAEPWEGTGGIIPGQS